MGRLARLLLRAHNTRPLTLEAKHAKLWEQCRATDKLLHDVLDCYETERRIAMRHGRYDDADMWRARYISVCSASNELRDTIDECR